MALQCLPIKQLLKKLIMVDISPFQRSFSSTRCLNIDDNQSLHFHPEFKLEKSKLFTDSLLVHEDFVTEEEEANLIQELEPHLKRHVYERDHWDNAIQGFRETERKHFNKKNSVIIERLKAAAFPSSGKILPYVHVLDLAEDGHILPHVDSIRFCGDTVAVLSLLASSVARFVHSEDKTQAVDALIKRRSLYVMKDWARFDFTHEILKNEESYFNGESIFKERRVSLLCRNEPSSGQSKSYLEQS